MENINEKYEKYVKQIMERLGLIKNLYKIKPESINWADVGSISHINDTLKQITVFLGLEEEKI